MRIPLIHVRPEGKLHRRHFKRFWHYIFWRKHRDFSNSVFRAKMFWSATDDQQKSRVRDFFNSVLKCGEIPRHVAFIMDGNRRYAKQRDQDRAQGHESGFQKLAETLNWCFELGIYEVTVYAFSIENFKRSKDEVDGLMELTKQKVTKLLEEKDKIMEHGICIRVLGDLTLLPVETRKVVAEVVTLTKYNDKCFLNVCFAYTSRHEIAEAVKLMAEGIELGILKPTDVTEALLEKTLYTNKSPDPDLLIRTSGEIRLSDFLLWQSSNTCITFEKALWPAFSIWDFYHAILCYQWNFKAIKKAREQAALDKRKEELGQAIEHVLENGIRLPENGATTETYPDSEVFCKDWIQDLLQSPSVQTEVEEFLYESKERRQTFLSFVDERRREVLECCT